MTALKYRTADLDGQKIFYREAGSAGAPKLLLLHGFPSASHMFRDLIPLLADGFHMVLHTSPNTMHKSETLGYWKTIDDDYHWHIEILPILGAKAKSYTFKEVYASPIGPEAAALKLRERPTVP